MSASRKINMDPFIIKDMTTDTSNSQMEGMHRARFRKWGGALCPVQAHYPPDTSTCSMCGRQKLSEPCPFGRTTSCVSSFGVETKLQREGKRESLIV
jgi:hypothetical protein